MIRYVGLDLHKRLIVVCILDAQGNVLKRARLETVTAARLAAFADEHLTVEDHVALEATTNCWAVARFLQTRVAQVVIGNPLTTKAIAQAKVKTDKVDATVLAHLLRLGYLPEVWQPDPATSRAREWTARRGRLISQRVALVNRIRTTLAMRLLDCPHEVCSSKGRQWLAEAALDDDARWLVESDLRLLDALAAEIAAIDKRLAQTAYADGRAKLLMTLPGVSQHVAQALAAAIGDEQRFRDAAHLASYLGLVPSTSQSAAKCYHGPITKAGRKQARWMLVQAAHAVRDNPGPLGFFFRKLKRRKNHNIAVVAVARKLAIMAWHVLASGQPYRYALPRATEAKLSKLRIAATGTRRRGGLGKGVDPRTFHAAGAQGRTQRGLSDVLQSEGLPQLGTRPAGEEKHLAALHLSDLPAQLDRARIVHRPPRNKPLAAAKSS